MALHIIACGGTFDQRYDEIKKTFGYADSHLAEAIASSRIALDVTFDQLFLPDSLGMRKCISERVLEACRLTNKQAVVIIHGTDTIMETAACLQQAALGKAVVFTNAIVPYGVGNSDALFNLGVACGVAQVLPPGIYTALRGVVSPLLTFPKVKSSNPS